MKRIVIAMALLLPACSVTVQHNTYVNARDNVVSVNVSPTVVLPVEKDRDDNQYEPGEF